MFNLFWPYSNRDVINDYVQSLRKIFNINNEILSISPNLDLISHNIFLENFEDVYIIDELNHFCKNNKKKVSIIATEFLEKNLENEEHFFTVNNERINETSYKNNNKYMTRRLYNLLKIKKNILSIINIFYLPKLNVYYEYLREPDIKLFELPVPNYQFNITRLNCDYDLYFSGKLTSYRLAIIDELSQKGFKILYEKTFVDEDTRVSNIKKANFCLNIPQDKKWKWSSTMRYMHALKNGRMVAEYKSNLLTNYFSSYCINFSNKIDLYKQYERSLNNINNKTNKFVPKNFEKDLDKFLTFVKSHPCS